MKMINTIVMIALAIASELQASPLAPYPPKVEPTVTEKPLTGPYPPKVEPIVTVKPISAPYPAKEELLVEQPVIYEKIEPEKIAPYSYGYVIDAPTVPLKVVPSVDTVPIGLYPPKIEVVQPEKPISYSYSYTIDAPEVQPVPVYLGGAPAEEEKLLTPAAVYGPPLAEHVPTGIYPAKETTIYPHVLEPHYRLPSWLYGVKHLPSEHVVITGAPAPISLSSSLYELPSVHGPLLPFNHIPYSQDLLKSPFFWLHPSNTLKFPVIWQHTKINQPHLIVSDDLGYAPFLPCLGCDKYTPTVDIVKPHAEYGLPAIHENLIPSTIVGQSHPTVLIVEPHTQYGLPVVPKTEDVATDGTDIPDDTPTTIKPVVPHEVYGVPNL